MAVVTDDFNRASVGANWSSTQGTAMSIQGSVRLQPNDSGLSHSTMVRTAENYGRDQYAKTALSSVESSNYAGVCVRADTGGATTMYFFHGSGFDVTVGRFVENTYTSLFNSSSYACANGDVLELRIVGRLLTALKNSVVIFTYSDPNPIISGNPGAHGYTNTTGTTSTSLDSWEAGDISTTQGAPMYVPHGGQDFGWIITNHTTRPAGAMGTALTPGNNTKGSWAQCFTAVANDVYLIRIVINSGSTSAAARDILVDIGIDEAGGSTYTVKIPDLIGSCANGMDVGGGISYVFPLFIRAGSTIAARASVNNATVGTVRAYIKLHGRPRNPEQLKVGSYVEAIGVTSASSSGTAVTPGTTAEGAWTSIGTISKSCWWWQAGWGVNDSTMAAVNYAVDIAAGDATNKDLLIEDQLWRSDASERHANDAVGYGCERWVPGGTNVYARAQCSGTADSSTSAVIYALGG